MSAGTQREALMRELDAKVAEKVMGWKLFPVGYEGTDDETPEQKDYDIELRKAGIETVGWYAWTGSNVFLWSDSLGECYKFTCDVSADYMVLKHVRETWTDRQKDDFDNALEDIMIEKHAKYPNQWFSILYEPGDWSRAALKALGEDI